MSSERDVRTAALLLLDFHSMVVVSQGSAGARAVERAANALKAAREHGVPVFHVVPNYRPGYPELADGEPFDTVVQAGLFRETPAGVGIEPRLAPQDDEAVIAKFRYSPFFANELRLLLRMRGVDTLVLAGVSTGGVVLSALRDAWDDGWRLTILEDACADIDEDVHRLLVTRLFPPQATVLTVDRWIEALQTPS